MSEIRALPWNGFKVVSTFSGCGGSCLGYRMAGFKIIWANEFVPAAQDSYRANMESDCILDPRDIRTVTAAEILAATGLKQGELDLFDGSPPCQAFSTAGKREKGWGKAKTYEHGAKQCNERLFDEYVRLLRGLKPKVFVAENVSGLVKGTAKGMFLEILAALKASGYRVICRVLDAQWLGVPQMRQRTIFIGVREDLNLDPVHPKPLPYRYSVRDALPWIGEIRQTGVFTGPDRVTALNVPASSVTAHGMDAKRKGAVTVRVIHDTSGLYGQGDITNRPAPTITVGVNAVNQNHFRVEIETDISRFTIGKEWDKLKPGEQSNKYFSLQHAHPDKSSPCVTMLAGTKQSAAGVMHPFERRKFTIAELKRICAFPDDFILTGSYSQQWERLGNAVPPVMMFHIASAIRDRILRAQASTVPADCANGCSPKSRCEVV
jgi:DNA (cytosine-5)-methyltransferase 1